MKPAEALKQLQIKHLSEARKCVALLATLDFVIHNPEHSSVKKKLMPHAELIKRARDARDQIRKRCDLEKREWLKGGEEYDAIERQLIKSFAPRLSQSEFQELERAYLEKLKTESIERWRRLPIVILQGGLPS